jgi:hypothetical protein
MTGTVVDVCTALVALKGTEPDASRAWTYKNITMLSRRSSRAERCRRQLLHHYLADLQPGLESGQTAPPVNPDFDDSG